MSNGVFNFNFLALVFSEILGGPTFTLGGHTPPVRTLAENFFFAPEFQHSSSSSFQDFRVFPPVRSLAENFLYPRRVRYYV